MAVIKRSILRNCNMLIAWFLSFFGVACSPFSAEYGTPEGKFVVNGTVKSGETSVPIEHIRVIMGNDTAFSDGAGKYKVSLTEFPVSQSFDLIVTDIDGPVNGTFESKDTLIRFDNPEFHDGDGHWYKGETVKEINVMLNLKR